MLIIDILTRRIGIFKCLGNAINPPTDPKTFQFKRIKDGYLFDTSEAEFLYSTKGVTGLSDAPYETLHYKSHRGVFFEVEIYTNEVRFSNEENMKKWLEYKDYPKYLEVFGKFYEHPKLV